MDRADLFMRIDQVADRELRLECAKLAGGRIDDAREIYAFVVGETDQSPGDRIRAALGDMERRDVS